MRDHIHFLADNGFIDDLKTLLQTNPGLLEATADEGQTPLWYAVFSGHTETVKYLLSLGADANARGGDYKWTPMHVAALKGRKDLVDLLKAHGGDENAKDITGETPLEMKKVGGCYIATACYGSYDHPDVLVLRRFRDDVLWQTVYGRLFIRAYYAISPPIAKHIGQVHWLSRIIRRWFLEPLVRKLR
ncbi:MAG: ankyrin repeat domain-containing protein [bacterium]